MSIQIDFDNACKRPVSSLNDICSDVRLTWESIAYATNLSSLVVHIFQTGHLSRCIDPFVVVACRHQQAWSSFAGTLPGVFPRLRVEQFQDAGESLPVSVQVSESYAGRCYQRQSASAASRVSTAAFWRRRLRFKILVVSKAGPESIVLSVGAWLVACQFLYRILQISYFCNISMRDPHYRNTSIDKWCILFV